MGSHSQSHPGSLLQSVARYEFYRERNCISLQGGCLRHNLHLRCGMCSAVTFCLAILHDIRCIPGWVLAGLCLTYTHYIQVGSGKSSLLEALLGEVLPIQDSNSSPRSLSNSPILRGHMAYCSQVPWIVSGTVRVRPLTAFCMRCILAQRERCCCESLELLKTSACVHQMTGL